MAALGFVLIDPETGLPAPPGTPALVKLVDAELSLGSTTSAEVAASAGAGVVIIEPIDMDGFKSVSVEASTVGAGGVAVVEFSNSKNFWSGAQGVNANSSIVSSTMASTGIRTFEKQGRYMRVRVTSLTSGNFEVSVCLNANDAPISAVVPQGLVAHGSGIQGNPLRMGARARTSNMSAVTNDQTVDLVASAIGHLLVNDPVSIGSPTDSAWDGSASSATVIALLKKIALNTAP